MAQQHRRARRLLLSVDLAGYGGLDERRQIAAQAGLAAVLNRAAVRARLARHDWVRQEAGDGEFAIVFDDEVRVLDGYVSELHRALGAYNSTRVTGDRLRVRLAIHVGVVGPGQMGFPGEGPVTVSRLVDALPLKALLAESGADLAVIISERVYRDTVVQRVTELAPEVLREVEVIAKEFRQHAWIHLPGHNVHSYALPPGPGLEPETDPKPEAASEEKPREKPTMSFDFHAPVTAEVIGVRW